LERDVKLHLSEVKGPVMDALKRSPLLRQLGGKVYLNHHAAVLELAV
jgi:SulP family sulfate permease